MTPTITLNDDNVIPVVGLGVAELSEDDTERAVTAASLPYADAVSISRYPA